MRSKQDESRKLRMQRTTRKRNESKRDERRRKHCLKQKSRENKRFERR
jgi:hypothetical protein